MAHTYRFASADQMQVIREDGVTFPWNPKMTRYQNGHVLGGFAGEDYRRDDCPEPAPYVPPAPQTDPMPKAKPKR